ncbi:MAG: glycosyltransferase family 4 protein [Steroidobacteraceae bacterium]
MRARKARVFFVNRYFYPDESATSQLLSDLAFGLVERGFDVHIVCSRQLYGNPEAKLPGNEVIRGVVIHRLWTTAFGRSPLAGRTMDYLSFYATCAIALIGLLRRSDIVVAKTDPPLISIVAAVSAWLRGAILVNWLQDVFPEVASHLGANPLPVWLDRPLRGLRNASLRAAAVNVVLGGRMREYVSAQRVPADKIAIIENWAATESPRPKMTRDSALRTRLGLQQKFVVGYSGNLGRAHEIATLLGAAETLRGDDNVAFLMIGGGINMDALKAQVAERQLSNMYFLPYQPRETLGDSLAAADVHLASLIPALEGLIVPSKFYGILAAGRPVIFVGDRDGELARVIRDTHCGLVVGMGQTAELVDAIRHLQISEDERKSMGLSSRHLLAAKYSAKRALGSWMDLIHRLQRRINVCASRSL